MESDVVAKMRSIRPRLLEHREWASANARMAPAVVEATRDAGLYTMLVPREMGGSDASFPDFLEVFADLGFADPTVGWHGVNSSYLAQAMGYVPTELQQPILDSPPGPYGFAGPPLGIATPVDGGYRLSGSWPFMTGAMDAPWSLFRGFVVEAGDQRMFEGQPNMYRFLLPAADYEVQHTWELASAMRGTGSHGVVVDDVFVPEGLAIPTLGVAEPVIASHAALLPNGAGMIIPAAVMAVGLAERVLREVRTISRDKVFGGVPYMEMPDRHYFVATAHATLDGSRAAIRAMAEHVDGGLGKSPDDVAPETRARMWATAYWVLDQAREVISNLASISTSTFYAKQNPIEMAVRDVHAISASLGDFRNLFGRDAGRVYLGLDPETAAF